MIQPYVLPYDLAGLEPHISRKTMDAHYNRHYLNYLRKLNELLVQNNTPQIPVAAIFSSIDIFPIQVRDDILYNAGGVANHELYFSGMRPNASKEIPEPLRSALIAKFGSLENFRNRLIEYATILPGSGYTFLVVNPRGDLVLMNLGNQESPYSYGMIPIMNIDVWEHAYYLDKLNERGKYIDDFLEVVDYNKINENYQNALLELRNR